MDKTEQKVRQGLGLYGSVRGRAPSDDASFMTEVRSGVRRRARARRLRAGVASVTASFLLLLVVHLSGPSGGDVQLHGVYLADAYEELAGYGNDSLFTLFSGVSMDEEGGGSDAEYLDLFEGAAVYSPVDQFANADDAALERMMEELAAFDLYEQSLAGATAGRES